MVMRGEGDWESERGREEQGSKERGPGAKMEGQEREKNQENKENVWLKWEVFVGTRSWRKGSKVQGWRGLE